MPDATSSALFEQLYVRHRGWLQGWLHRRLGNNADAEDLAHDTFIRILHTPQLIRRTAKESRITPLSTPT
jgi:DNA-directed RNA polymerase specialized sigma24 family protein